jgi:hypothetical protein
VAAVAAQTLVLLEQVVLVEVATEATPLAVPLVLPILALAEVEAITAPMEESVVVVSLLFVLLLVALLLV